MLLTWGFIVIVSMVVFHECCMDIMMVPQDKGGIPKFQQTTSTGSGGVGDLGERERLRYNKRDGSIVGYIGSCA